MDERKEEQPQSSSSDASSSSTKTSDDAYPNASSIFRRNLQLMHDHCGLCSEAD